MNRNLVPVIVAAVIAGVAVERRVVADLPLNPDFSDAALANWNPEGFAERLAVVVSDTDPTEINAFALMSEVGGNPVTDGNGLARIYQQFSMDANPPKALTFRYRLWSTGGMRGVAQAPDSFSVWLRSVDAMDVAGASVVPPPDVAPGQVGDALSYSDAFFYEDSDGVMLRNPDYVTLTEPDASGFRTVALRLNALDQNLLSGQRLQLEFGFAHARNGVTSFAAVDDLLLECPPGYCCSDDLLVMNLLDDGNECTNDCCETVQNGNCPAECSPTAGCNPGCDDSACSHTGIALHDPTGPQCGDMDLVFIIDTSCSMIDEADSVCQAISALASDPALGHVKFDILVINTQGLNGNCGADGDSVLDTLISNCPQIAGEIDLVNNLNDHLVTHYGSVVPVEMDPLEDYTCSTTLASNCSTVSQAENWGPAVAVVAKHYTWRQNAIRVIVPISDEAPCMGSDRCNDGVALPRAVDWCTPTPGMDECPNPQNGATCISCCDSDASSVINAIAVANNQVPPVIVAPVISPINHVVEARSCIVAQAQALAMGTQGIAVDKSGPNDVVEMTGITINILLAACGCN